jgi:hypothetical protein
MDHVTVNRSKLYPTPGRNYRAAWRWLYTVRVDGINYQGEGLSWARGLAKRKANGRKVVELWT